MTASTTAKIRGRVPRKGWLLYAKRNPESGASTARAQIGSNSWQRLSGTPTPGLTVPGGPKPSRTGARRQYDGNRADRFAPNQKPSELT
ncbi:hypothetical protein AY599_25705 [Leptolyngbya valderiana BDU 20041]|nr:hypothetical protein AY599_25705 [Leptolyngbya valderiana BDU 20041]